MKRFPHLWILFAAVALTLTSCEAIGDIFQAGMWVGVLIVVGIIALVIWLVSRFRR